jgi:Tat protein translocase TatB subunit
MFGIGMPELMLIFVLALLVFGPKELPKIARTIGKAMGELRRASDELRDGIQREVELAEREEAPSSPPEAVPSTTLAEGASPALETPPGLTPVGEPTETSGTPPETVAAEAPAETITPAPGEQASQTTAEETAETATASAPPETSEAKEGQEAPGEHRPQAETSSRVPAQPVETRNA